MSGVEIEARAVDGSERNRELARRYIESDGREVDHPMADRIILLYTTGRRSGEIRRSPLASFADGDDLLVIASKGGSPSHPDWYRNLAADPNVWVRRGGVVYSAVATELDGDERERLWEDIIAHHPVFGRYQDVAGRRLPLVRLTAV